MVGHLYVMPTVFGPLESLMEGVKVGKTVNQPWERLRAFQQPGILYSFRYVFSGPLCDISNLESEFHKENESSNIRSLIPGVTCKEVFAISVDDSIAILRKIIVRLDLNVSLLYENYSACNKAQHEKRYPKQSGHVPRSRVDELFVFPDDMVL